MATPAALRALAQAIAGCLGPDWLVVAADADDSSRAAFLRDTSGNRLHLAPAYDAPGRLIISASLPEGVSRRHGRHGVPGITVAADRPPEAIARDITRRLLPDAQAWWAEQREFYAADQQYEAQRAALMARLSQASGGLLVPNEQSLVGQGQAGMLHFEGWRDGLLHEYGEAEVRTDYVIWKLKLEPELAERVARALAGTAGTEGA